MLGQLVLTREVASSKINNMKENKSPGVDGLAPKILKETVEQIVRHLYTCITCQCRMELPTFRIERSKHYSFIQQKVQETSL